MANPAKGRIEELRTLLKKEGVDFYIVPTADFHGSEYVGAYFMMRSFLSGFTGSAGTLVVSADEAGLWTDGRYFEQAKKQLEGSGVTLYKMDEEGVPTIREYLEKNVKDGQTVGFDGKTVDAEFGLKLEKKYKLLYSKDIADKVWDGRPHLSATKAWIVSERDCGMSVQKKLELVREKMAGKQAEHLLISKLDDIMWLYNIRANDVEHNPAALSYTFISKDSAALFIQESALTKETKKYFEESSITVREYSEIAGYLENCKIKGKIWYSEKDINYFLYKLIEKRGELVNHENPTALLKATKNPVELENIRKYYLLDSAALTKFLFWIKNNVGKEKIDEFGAAKRIDAMRAEIPGFLDLSFNTISAYKENAAMPHYDADEENSSRMYDDGFYLVDSGGQYMGATTDVTRTVALGNITDEMKMHFTKVACAMLRLADVKFLHGCTGRNLDIIARQPLWECGLDYKHGTGHGIGYILNVHEGPQAIRWQYKPENKETVLDEGMLVSDEPGVYIPGSHGIRTENILEVVKEQKNEHGQFMGFRHLTHVPIDLDAIDAKYMELSDIERLNAYHKNVYKNLLPYFKGDEAEQLKRATREVGHGGFV